MIKFKELTFDEQLKALSVLDGIKTGKDNSVLFTILKELDVNLAKEFLIYLSDILNEKKADLKVLEIIKEKVFNIEKSKNFFTFVQDDEEKAYFYTGIRVPATLSKDEFNLIKEWIERD